MNRRYIQIKGALYKFLLLISSQLAMAKPKRQTKAQVKTAKKAEPAKKVAPAKEKKIVKPKQYKKKTADELARINRSKVQRIFLINAARNTGSWDFTVQGTTGSMYYVHTSTHVSCTCMDFKVRKNICKHVYFIVTQVGQNDDLLNCFKSGQRTISKAAFKLLDENLTERLKARLEKPAKDAKDIDLKDDPTCIVCFLDMDKDAEKLEDCGSCKRYFHSECIAAWKGHSPSCPFCRGNLDVVGGGGEGALGKLNNIRL